MRRELALTLVANQPMRVPSSPYIITLVVGSGFDVADDEIVRRMVAGDLVITSDIPLAAQVLESKGHALSPRGEWFTPDTIGARRDMRDFLETLRGSGIHTGGPPPLKPADRAAFANHLDRFLARVG